MGRRKQLLVGALTLGLIVPATFSHVRLFVFSTGAELAWPDPSNVPIVLNAAGSGDVSDGTDLAAIRNAIQSWNDAVGSSIRLVEDTSPSQQARTDYWKQDLQTVLFDENDTTGYFPGGIGAVAITQLAVDPNGKILDADILLNGVAYQFTTSKSGGFDIGEVVTHELGHFLGLDHSGFVGGVMLPYVGTSNTLGRSISMDEVNGMRDAYPSATFASITGTVRRSSSSTVVKGAYVIARDSNGRTYGADLTADDGTFFLHGIEPDTYSLYVVPLIKPVGSNDISGKTIQTDFGATELGNPVVVGGSQSTVNVGTILAAPPVFVRLGDDQDDFPLRTTAGVTTFVGIHGKGLVAGSVIEASDPSITIGTPLLFGVQANFDVIVPPGAEPGHVDLKITAPGGSVSILPAALEITPPDPVVASVFPAVGPPAGGTTLEITGTGFRPRARVVIGDQIYVAGEPGGAIFVDSTKLVLTTRPTFAAVHDVVVIDESGVEGRRIDGFETAPQSQVVVSGTPCSYYGALPQIGGSGVAKIGASAFYAEVTNVPGGVRAFLYVGTSKVLYQDKALPLELTEFGLNGCYLYQNLTYEHQTQTVGTAHANATDGFAKQFVPIPNETALIGVTLPYQWLIANDHYPGEPPVAGSALAEFTIE